MSTATDRYEECLAALRAGDAVTPVEQLRRATIELLDWLPEGVEEEQLKHGMPALHERLEQCLAFAQPLLDFGGPRGIDSVGWMLQTLASLHGDSSNLLREPMISLALHDLSWTLLADCLARDSFEPLPRLAAVVVPDPYEDVGVPIFSTPGLRHTNAYERGADKTYLGWHEWLSTGELFAAMPHLAPATRLADSIAEAELLAALLFAAAHAEGFCAALGSRGGRRQLQTHLTRPGFALALAKTFGIERGELSQRLNELYASVVGPDNLRPRTNLVPS